MSIFRSVPALALATALAGAAGATGFMAGPAFAQASTTAPQAPRQERHVDPGRHVEGRIAFLKAELKITDAQAPQFDRVAQAMRENARERRQLFEQFRADRDKPQSAVERLEARTRISESRAQQEQRFLAAFKPLYDSLSDDQKRTADELLAPRHHWRGHHP
jgi:Spy/CpxP family protein refolding chaperone